ncbi:MAG: NAD(P)/FAD-dependent oxidoreductase, partial [Solobacterium sp.]|nr:NAD(P)/FAD-dependent oxidoreductase [Solobacterium sp.]
MNYDITIIGAGIVGSSIAYRLSKYDCKLLVIDKENDIANEVSMANSAIIHAGHDPKEGTLKAKLNVEGNRMYPKLCEDIGASFSMIGAYTIMHSLEQEETFNALVERAKARDIPYEILTREEALKKEPNLTDQLIKVLSLPSTGIIMPWEVSLKQLQVAYLNGTEVKLNTEVLSIEKMNDHFLLHTNHGDISTQYVINAAGLFADTIANMIEDSDYRIKPRRGEYFVLSHEAKDFVKHVIYPIPTAKGKGILAIPTVDGNILLGPNAEDIEDKNGINTTSAGLAFVRERLSDSVKNIPFHQIIRTFAGLRPTVETKDFIIEFAKTSEHFLNLIGIDSPGIASAPAIAKYVEEVLKLPYSIKEKYETKNPYRNTFKTLTKEEKNTYIQTHPSFGNIVCRCEQISEGEVVEAIHEPLGATTIKGIKKRVRPGMGKCQGGFCQPLILEILARELNCKPEDVLYDQVGSQIV